MHKKPNVGIWCAVSSKAQAAADKISLTAQEQAGRKLAEAIDGHVTAVYIVPGHTRDIIFWSDAEHTMDAYRELRADVQAGHLDVLHAMDADRLGRDPALSNQLVSLCEKNGCEVYLASNPHIIGQKSAAQRYIFAITSTRAGEDQQRRREYHRRGMINRIQHGLHPSGWPYGYTAVRDNSGRVIGAELNEHAPVILLAGELFIKGHSYRAIARALEQSGHRPPAARSWRGDAINRLLRRDTYGGIIRWGKNKTRSNKFPAIWPDKLYTAILKEQAARDGSRGRRTNTRLWKIAYCARCSKAMHGAGTQDNKRRLNCQTYKRFKTCHSNSLYTEKIKVAIYQYLEGLLALPNLNDALRLNDIGPELEQKIAETDKQIKSTEQKRTRLALALAAGDMNTIVYRRADELIATDLQNLQNSLADLQVRLTAAPNTTARIDTLNNLRDKLPRLWHMPPQECNALLRHLGIRVDVENCQVVRVHMV